MQADRQKYIDQLLAEGERDAQIIMSESDAEVAAIVAEGREEAAAINAETEREDGRDLCLGPQPGPRAV